MLGTPPAFVLSQDQTLKKFYLKHFRASNHFLNNLLLAILLKNFRWLKIRLHDILNNSSIVQGVYSSSLRYSIYKVQNSLNRSAVSLFNLAHLSSFVKNFFQVFTFFFSRWHCFAPLTGALQYNNRSIPFCQALF